MFKNSMVRLSDEQIEKMTPAELRSVAISRGYEPIGALAGRAASRAAFRRAQDEDPNLIEPSEAVEPSQPAAVASGEAPKTIGEEMSAVPLLPDGEE